MHGKMQLILTSSFTPYFKQCGNTRQLLILYTKQRQNYWRSASYAIFKITKKKTFTARYAFQNVEFHWYRPINANNLK